ncbi:hypothetical protein R1sor_024170 [Riccia sorocarpa]|uniref:Reverse transcriptase domain-containing protein n=1 Tax=Riccia sorocarpa TaxID=122646 RepID=A0ABD3GVQ8_9MARC
MFRKREDEFRVVSVYSPNDARERTLFWRQLRGELPGGSWLAVGDWNSVVSPLDLSSKSNLQSEEEVVEFLNLCSSLGVCDARDWAAKAEGPSPPRPFLDVGSYPHYCVSECRRLSPGSGAYFKADPYVVRENLEYLKAVWAELDSKFAETPPMERLLRCWFGLRREIKVLQYRKKSTLLQLPSKDRQLQDLLKEVPELSAHQEMELVALMNEVRELQAWNHHRWRITCREKFIQEWEACTGYFFRRFRRRKARTMISRLRTEGGDWLQDPEDIKKAVHDNFSSLYSRGEILQQEAAARSTLLEATPQHLSSEQIALLEETPTEKEIFDSMMLLPQGKSPGVDGMGPEVMRVLWPTIGGLYCLAALDFWDSGVLLPFFKDGLIFLIPKVDFPETLGHRRPITLLNAIYKVLAKLLAARLALILPSLVPREQQGFIKGRSPQNCVLIFSLVHEVLKRERRSAIFISLDQDKAYDRLLPEFLREVLQHLQFPDKFTRAVMALQEAAESRILLNNQLLPPFKVGRGVRQGCPLSPLLFVLASVPLIQKIKDDNANDFILPVPIGRSIRMSSMCLADDLAVFTQVHRDSIVNLLAFLDLVEMATGGRVNLQKSDKLLREFLWSTNSEGRTKKSLAAWEFVVLPFSLGGLGVFAVKDFQLALICRSILKAMEDPGNSLSTSIFAEGFLFAVQVVPATTDTLPPGQLKHSLFLFARKNCGVKDATVVSSRAFNTCLQAGVTTLLQLRDWLTSVGVQREGIPTDEEFLLSGVAACSVPSGDLREFNPEEWKMANGVQLNVWKMGMPDFSCQHCKAGVEDLSHTLWLCPRWASFWEELVHCFPSLQPLNRMRGNLAMLPEVLLWAQEGMGVTKFFTVWLLASAWRILWAERCIYKFQSRKNKVTVVRVALTMLEELRARQTKFDREWVKHIASSLLSVIPIPPKRYQALITAREE